MLLLFLCEFFVKFFKHHKKIIKYLRYIICKYFFLRKDDDNMSDYNLKIFTDNIEPTALNQIYELVKQPAFSDCKVRIMPDVHAGAGCVIGFTADLGEKVIPNIVGVDIGCGMLAAKLGKIDIDYAELDRVIREFIPYGRNVRDDAIGCKLIYDDIDNLKCYKHLKDIDRIKCSLGTLGSGNHFVEVDESEDGTKYLIIHTGSRNLGKQVAEYYQNRAIEEMSGKDELEQQCQNLIKQYKADGRQKEIEKALSELRRKWQNKKLNVPKELCYLTGQSRLDYLHDMTICQQFASLNRLRIFLIIARAMGWEVTSNVAVTHDAPNLFETVHNYIDFTNNHDTNMVRKGAISAKKGEYVLIPMNMRDGCILGIGKGNEDWNCSAPHGAGRLMSRSMAKDTISLDEYKNSMQGIYTTSVCQETIDESPQAYKSKDEIVKLIEPTVEVIEILKPVYNFKAN